MIDSIFGNVAMGAVPDPTGNTGRFMYVTYDGEQRFVSCDIIRWQAPDGQELIVYVSLRCPECEFPIVLPATQYATGLDADTGDLTLKVKLSCPGHWQTVDTNGRAVGGRTKCGWEGVIRDGIAHKPTCHAASFREDASCTCMPKARD